MASIINASSTGSGGIVQTADASGVLQLQSNGTVAVNIASGGAVGIGGITNPTFPLVVQTSGTSTAVAGNVIARLQSTNTGYDATLQFSDNITNSGFMSMNSGNMIIGSYGTESIRFKSGGTVILQNGSTSATGIGITFPATQSASSDANTLDDYEEGSWTPVWWGGSASPTYTLGNTAARYVKIGRMVFFNLSIQWSGKAGGSGTLGISLPFPVSNISNFWCGSTSVGFCGGLAFSVSGTYTDPGQSNMFFRKFDTLATLLQVSDLGASGHVMMGGCYLVD